MHSPSGVWCAFAPGWLVVGTPSFPFNSTHLAKTPVFCFESFIKFLAKTLPNLVSKTPIFQKKTFCLNGAFFWVSFCFEKSGLPTREFNPQAKRCKGRFICVPFEVKIAPNRNLGCSDWILNKTASVDVVPRMRHSKKTCRNNRLAGGAQKRNILGTQLPSNICLCRQTLSFKADSRTKLSFAFLCSTGCLVFSTTPHRKIIFFP